MNAKVAILQNVISKGGRWSVLARMIKNLNSHDLIPDLITGRIDFKLSEVEKWYGFPVEANIIEIHNYWKHFSEFNLLYFNKKVTPQLQKYDWVINSSNTSHYLRHENLFEYVHYPRFRRILDKELIHENFGLIRLQKYFENMLVKQMYTQSKYPKCDVYTNSKFTAEKFREIYPDVEPVRVLYPPVEIPSRIAKVYRNRNVINLGRFHPSKKQLELVIMAEKMPDFNFYIVGFASNRDPYLKKCVEYIEEHSLNNVHLYPNVSIEKRDMLLNECSFFLHLLHDEPFGISTTQGIAHGCIPVAPDSGGQKEIVINENLRFTLLEQVPDILSRVDSLSDKDHSTLYSTLSDNIRKFSTAEFDRKFNEIIQHYVSK